MSCISFFKSLAGKEIVVVGASSGLGSVTAQLLVNEGAHVFVTYNKNRDAIATIKGTAGVIQADITRAEDRARVLEAVPDLYGLVIFSGIPARVREPSELEQTMRDSLEVNYLGPILLARAAANQMKERGTPGSIVLLSTMQAVSLFPGSTAYATAKAALIHAARVLAKEVRGPSNIRVNVVAPGVTTAGMAAASVASGKYNAYLESGAIPRFGRAEDVARAVRFFLEPDNYITGQILTVDGGLTL